MGRLSTSAAITFSRGLRLRIDLELAWYCIGLVVGEGSFTDHRGQPALTVNLHAEDPEPLEALRLAFGGRIYGRYVHDDRHHSVWVLRGAELQASVPFFAEYLPPSRKRRQFDRWLERWWWQLERPSRMLLERAAQ